LKKKSNHIDLQKHLTQAELLDYTNGVLGNQEMYRLELHLNECELCSDALDGISVISSPKEILEAIDAKVLPAKKKAFAPNYMAVAASVALLAVLGLSYWLITKPTQIDTIAINSTSEVAEVLASDTLGEPAPEEKTEEPVGKITVEPEVLEEDIESTDFNEPEAVGESKSQLPAKQKTGIRQKEIEPVEVLVTVTDVSGEMAKEDDMIQLEEIITEPINEGNNNYIDSQPARTASRVAKKSSSSGSVRLKDRKEPEPVGGMATLKSHISKNLKYPQAAIDNNIKGTVVLEVNINTDGTINNITVIKGLSFGCDAEAMRLVANGPKWRPKVENGQAIKATKQVKIKFKE